MKTTLAILLLSTVSIFASRQLDPKFLHALNMVEASGREGYIVGDNGKALGPFQIHRSYWEDAGVHGCYSMVTNRVYAMQALAIAHFALGRKDSSVAYARRATQEPRSELTAEMVYQVLGIVAIANYTAGN